MAPGRRSIGDWFPTRGEAEGTIRVKGSVGSKRMSGRRFGARARRKRENSKENSQWHGYMGYHPDLSSGSWLEPTNAGTAQRIIVINPYVDADSIMGTTFAKNIPGLNRRGKIKRLQGKISCSLAKNESPDALTTIPDDVRVMYWWMVQKGPSFEQTVPNDSAFTLNEMSSSDEATRAISSRRLLAWGSVDLHREWKMDGDITPNEWDFTTASTALIYTRLQKVNIAKIPLPRLPKEGIVIDSETSLVCYARALRWEPAQLVAGPESTSPYYEATGDARWFYFPEFRYLMSYDSD